MKFFGKGRRDLLVRTRLQEGATELCRMWRKVSPHGAEHLVGEMRDGRILDIIPNPANHEDAESMYLGLAFSYMGGAGMKKRVALRNALNEIKKEKELNHLCALVSVEYKGGDILMGELQNGRTLVVIEDPDSGNSHIYTFFRK